MGTTTTSPALGRHWGAFGFALVALTPLSCSFVFDAETEQCSTDRDCSDRQFADAICVAKTCKRAPAPPADLVWGCLDGPPLMTSRDEQVDIQIEVVRPGSNEPRRDATVNVCSRFDAPCMTPLIRGLSPDTAGRVAFQVPQNFDGFLEVFGPQGPAVDDPGFVRMLVFLPPREIVRGAQGRGVLVFDRATMNTLSQLGSSISSGFDNQTGLVVMTALTCASQLTAGVSYDLKNPSLSTSTKPFYTINRIPLQSASETDGSGTGGFTNVTPGPVQLGATLNSPQQRPITAAGGTLAYVRAGWYTQVYVAP